MDGCILSLALLLDGAIGSGANMAKVLAPVPATLVLVAAVVARYGSRRSENTTSRTGRPSLKADLSFPFSWENESGAEPKRKHTSKLPATLAIPVLLTHHLP
jgi:hypothetical protein